MSGLASKKMQAQRLEASKRRCPFLLNVLHGLGLITKSRSLIEIDELLLFPDLVRHSADESNSVVSDRVSRIETAWPADVELLDNSELGILRE